MNEIKNEAVKVFVSIISPLGWWIGNREEHVAAGTALGSDCTEVIFTPSAEGLTGKFNPKTYRWKEVEDKSLDKFWAESGQDFVIGVPDGELPEWAITEEPPTFDIEKETVFYSDGAWTVFPIILDKSYWTATCEELIVSVFNFVLPAEHTFTPPPVTEEGFVARLESDVWVLVEDHRGATIYAGEDSGFHKEQLALGPVESGFILDTPSTPFDVWIDSEWVTDLAKKYEHDFNTADAARRSAYTSKVDPLLSEAVVKRLLGDIEEAVALETKALALRLEIQTEYPFPTPLV